jgi:hypothetical protein
VAKVGKRLANHGDNQGLVVGAKQHEETRMAARQRM